MSEYIITYKKQRINPLAPDKNSILIEDIAHALSRICRGNGQLPIFFSVAQHSILCCKEAMARNLSAKLCLACLLHDASESYLADIVRPVKKNLQSYMEIEKTLQELIYEKFVGNLSEAERIIIAEIDDAILYQEFYTLMNEKILEELPIKTKPEFVTLEFATVEKEFLMLYNKLSNIIR